MGAVIRTEHGRRHHAQALILLLSKMVGVAEVCHHLGVEAASTSFRDQASKLHRWHSRVIERLGDTVAEIGEYLYGRMMPAKA